METINKSHRYAIDCFAKVCQEQIGIKPLDDDRLILKAAIDFGTYIKTFKRLDHSVNWHQHFIASMVRTKINTLSNRINTEYGTHERYLNKMRQRHDACGNNDKDRSHNG